MIFARQEHARREEDGPARCSRSRSPWVRYCGNCLPAGAGLLTWWRRRARRAPARQGAAGRPPRSLRGARLPYSALAVPCQLTLSLGGLVVPASEPGKGPDGLARPEGVPLKT